MSDSFGGNLQSDMPGIDTAPPTTGIARSPLQLPTALQGLAKQFQGSQGQPKTKFQPPKPPVLTEEQANQPPQHVGHPASFAPIPATIPSYIGGFTPYIKTQDKRDPSQWTDPVRFPRLPATFEVMPMLGEIGKYFAQAGGDVGQAGQQLGYHSDEFWRGFNNQQDHMMKMAKEGASLALDNLELSTKNRLLDYRSTIAEYKAAGGAGKLVGGVSLYDALYADAVKNRDDPAIRMFEAGLPLTQIENYLGEADKVLRDLQAAKTKASQQDDTDSTYGLEPKKDTPGFRAGGETDQPAPAPPATDSAPAPAPKTTDADAPEIFKGLHPELVNAATDMFLGDEPKGLKNMDLHNVRILRDRMGAALTDIQHDPNIKSGDYVSEVRKRLGDRIADELKGIEDYSNPALTSGTGYGAKAGILRELQDIAAKDMPGDAAGKGKFNAANFKLREEFNKDRNIVTTLTRTNDMASALNQTGVLLDRIHNELKKKGLKDTQVNLGAIADILGGGTYATLNSQLNNFAAAYNAILSSGHITITGQEIVASDLTTGYRPLSSVRDIIKTHIPTAQGILKGVHNNWDARGGGPNPMFDAGSEKTIDDWGKVDIKTGVRPGMVVIHKFPDGHTGKAQWTGVNPVDREADENWIEQ